MLVLHPQRWSVRARTRRCRPSNIAGRLSEIIVLGDIALLHPGWTLLWDAQNMKISNDEAADKSLFMRCLAPRDDMNWC